MGVVMQVEAFVIAADMDVPSAIDATAMPVPTMANINAYSAADAPFSFARNDLINLVMSKPLFKATMIAAAPSPDAAVHVI